MRNFGKRTLLKVVTLAAAGAVLSGCVYDVGLGYASDGYYDDYSCDPYGGYDSYYDCDYGSGFFNIGFGGGWYDSYWYPGYGYYLFDNYGRRHVMGQHHRRYWGERRHSWYRENRARHRGNGRYEGRDNSNATTGAMGGQVRDDDWRGRGEGRRGSNGQWRGGEGHGANAVPTPNPNDVSGRRGDGRSGGRWRGSDNPNAVPQPGGAERRGDGRQSKWQQSAPQPSSSQGYAPAARPAPPPRNDSPRREANRQRVGEGGIEQPQ